MWETDKFKRQGRRPGCRQAGATAVEFAVVVIIFFILVFGVLELARAMFLFNTLQESTRRAAAAAANTDFRDSGALDAVRANAVFRTSAGRLVLGDPVTDKHVRIDYMSISNTGGALALRRIDPASLPTCPSHNRLICLANPHDDSCIQMVRVQICQTGGSAECAPVRYRALFPLITMPLDLPKAVTLVPAGSLGATVGTMPCI